ncbi:MAG: hypothetical protein QM535_08545 [Limnohabitans sp.]|nr:hypothetical protein [Limnohabitans sp.]
MQYEINKFYQKENDNFKLKKKYLIHYSFKPGFYDKLCSVNLIIDNKLNYQLFLFFYESNIPKKEREEYIKSLKSIKEARTFLYQTSKLPFKIRKEIKVIFENELLLKNSYYNDKNVFGISDRNEKYIKLNHKNGNFTIDLTIDTLNEALFEQISEVKFLKFTKNLEKWINKLRDDLIKPYDISIKKWK